MHQRTCGIRGFGRSPARAWSLPTHWCSTPCGIRGFGRGHKGGDQERDRRATTPCGIRGFGQQIPSVFSAALFSGAQSLAASEVLAVGMKLPVLELPEVLNALRHQSFGRRGKIKGVDFSFPCSTHLAASEVLAEPQVQRTIIGSIGCSTPCGIRGFGSVSQERDGRKTGRQCSTHLRPSEVLAVSSLRYQDNRKRCSTPCGIRGFGSCSK